MCVMHMKTITHTHTGIQTLYHTHTGIQTLYTVIYVVTFTLYIPA